MDPILAALLAAESNLEIASVELIFRSYTKHAKELHPDFSDNRIQDLVMEMFVAHYIAEVDDSKIDVDRSPSRLRPSDDWPGPYPKTVKLIDVSSPDRSSFGTSVGDLEVKMADMTDEDSLNSMSAFSSGFGDDSTISMSTNSIPSTGFSGSSSSMSGVSGGSLSSLSSMSSGLSGNAVPANLIGPLAPGQYRRKIKYPKWLKPYTWVKTRKRRSSSCRPRRAYCYTRRQHYRNVYRSARRQVRRYSRYRRYY